MKRRYRQSPETLAEHFLRRLERLWRLRRDFAERLNDLGLDMLERAWATTLTDCEMAGVSAAEILAVHT